MITKLSLKEFYQKIDKSLSKDFDYSVLETEISSMSQSHSGHLYYTFSDGERTLMGVFFRGQLLRRRQQKSFKEGDKVIASGELNLYEKGGRLSLILSSLEPFGEGDFKKKFEALKKKLTLEGLFDPFKKKGVNPLSQKIAVITSEQGDALKDSTLAIPAMAAPNVLAFLPLPSLNPARYPTAASSPALNSASSRRTKVSSF